MYERTWIVGSAADSDIWVESSTVSTRHCRLTQRGEAFLLEDLGSTNGTYVDGQRITGPRLIRRGDRVSLGRDIPIPWPSPGASITIGRASDNDVVIPLDMVSACHARLDQEGRDVYIVDLGSSNGTAVNDPREKINRARVHPTDVVFFGTHRVSVAELMRALPKPAVPRQTVLESSSLNPLEAELAGGGRSVDSPDGAGSTTNLLGPLTSWVVGLVLSSALLALFVFVHSVSDEGSRDAAGSPGSKPAGEETAGIPHDDRETGQSAAPKRTDSPSSRRQSPPETDPLRCAIAAADELRGAVVLLGVQLDGKVVASDYCGWLAAPRHVVCATMAVRELQQQLHADSGVSVAMVVCTSSGPVPIVSVANGEGLASDCSVVELAAPVEATCPWAETPPSVEDLHEVVLLAARTEDRTTIALEYLTAGLQLARVDPEGADRPSIYRFTPDPGDQRFNSEPDLGWIAGAPIWNSSGRVIGTALQSASEIQVLPAHYLHPMLTTVLQSRSSQNDE